MKIDLERKKTDKCHICLDRPTMSHNQIWDGKDFLELGEENLRALKLHELRCMKHILMCKDMFRQSDYTGLRMISRIIEEKKEDVCVACGAKKEDPSRCEICQVV
jgi:hypothetical protein